MKTLISVQKIFWYFIICILLIHVPCQSGPPPCFSDIYCHGPILDTVQMSRTFTDSKDFVDMKMRKPPAQIKQAFENFMKRFTNEKPNRRQIWNFVAKNFHMHGDEFEEWTPSDWTSSPKFLEEIRDKSLRGWACKLNQIWNQLGRKIKDDVRINKDLYSIIWVPNPSIVPGGRFREFYYWDSYWIIKGLLLSEMVSTVKGMLENFLYMVDHYGLVPNGGRVYYLGRSQPPLLIPMIQLYYDATGDNAFIASNIGLMEKEFEYWMSNHTKSVTVKGVKYTLATYGDYTSGPRPESYHEDVTSASIFHEESKKDEFYSQLKAAAESGWDFSSRWFIKGTSNKGNLTNIRTRDIVPVDLNAILYWNAKILANFYVMLSNPAQATKYEDIASKWLTAVTAVLWHEDVGVWLDYDLHNNMRRNYFSPANVYPLLTKCYNSSDKIKKVEAVIKYLKRVGFLYAGGVPTTFYETGEQWDFPIAWPPLQHMMIMGLHETGLDDAMDLAYEIAETWVDTNYAVFKDRAAMFEKYDAKDHGTSGYGGEYAVQLGFGWSNGVIMDLLHLYGHKITASHAGFSLVGPNFVLSAVKLICLFFLVNMV